MLGFTHKNCTHPFSVRLEAIAADAGLQEKSLSELQRLMVILHDGCVQAEEQHRAKYVVMFTSHNVIRL